MTLKEPISKQKDIHLNEKIILYIFLGDEARTIAYTRMSFKFIRGHGEVVENRINCAVWSLPTYS